MSAFGNKEIELECSACSKSFRATADQLSQAEFGCPHCGDKTEPNLWREGLEEADRILGAMKKYQDN